MVAAGATSSSPFRTAAPLYAATDDKTGEVGLTVEKESDAPLLTEEQWMLELETRPDLKRLRVDLVEKYMSTGGRSREQAEEEADEFLSDPERATQLLEMRRAVMAESEGGLDSLVTIGGAFAVGLTAQVAFKYYSAYMSVYPEGGGPIPFL